MKSGLVVVAAVTWIAALYKLPRGRRTGPVDWALAGTLAALALGLTLKVPAVYRVVDSVSGRTNLAQLPKDAAVVLSAFGTQVILLHLVHGGSGAGHRARRRTFVVVAAVLAMANIDSALATTYPIPSTPPTAITRSPLASSRSPASRANRMHSRTMSTKAKVR